MRTRVIFYSLSGTARAVAETIARDLAADIEEIKCPRYRKSIMGFLRAGYDGWNNKLPPIDRLQRAPADYDLIVVGGPIWAWHAATPVRSFLQMHKGAFADVAFFLTHGGSSPDGVFREMEGLAGKAPKATIAVRTADVERRTFTPAVAEFVATLRASMTS